MMLADNGNVMGWWLVPLMNRSRGGVMSNMRLGSHWNLKPNNSVQYSSINRVVM